MKFALRADVKEYIPSWIRKQPEPAHSATTPSLNSGFTTSMTSTNVVTVHSRSSAFSPTHNAHPPATAGALSLRSPTTALRFPTRMSPIHAPFPSASSPMNPNAKDFVPHLMGASSLAALPTSTAELAEEQQRQQKRHVESSPSAKWTTTSTKNNVTQPTMSPACGANFLPTVVSALMEKTDEEILEISQRSSLRADAAVFVPRRTLNRPVIGKPSPFSLTPATPEMTLGDPWCLFYLPANLGGNIRENTYDPTLVFQVDSVATFWKVFNNVPEPTEMGVGTLYLFRDGINPKWEDPSNRDGGVVKMKLDFAHVNEAWVLLLCRTIGESWSSSVRNLVNGVVLKARGRAYVLEVWVTRQSPELTTDISELLQPTLGAAFSLTYAPHSVTQQRAADAAALADGKKNRGNHRRRW